MKEKEIILEPKYNISSQLAQGELVALNCTHNKELIFVIAKKKLDYREEKSGGTFAKIRTKQGQSYSIYYSVDQEILHLADIEDEQFNIHNVQLIGNDKILLVCARCQYRANDDFDLNGRIYSVNGELLDEILLGDGIQDVQTSKNGVIWTSYFDEGIFGNYGWNDPVGSSGLIAWKDNGKKLYSYEPRLGLDYMCDCYALNVESNSTVWCYYYTDFPLVKIKNDEIIDFWELPISGSDTFAIYRNFTLFRGGYDDNDSFHLFELNKNHVANHKSRVVLGNVNRVDLVCSRGDSMYVLSGSNIFELKLFECL